MVAGHAATRLRPPPPMPLQPFAGGLLAEAMCPEDVKSGGSNGSRLVFVVQVFLHPRYYVVLFRRRSGRLLLRKLRQKFVVAAFGDPDLRPRVSVGCLGFSVLHYAILALRRTYRRVASAPRAGLNPGRISCSSSVAAAAALPGARVTR